MKLISATGSWIAATIAFILCIHLPRATTGSIYDITLQIALYGLVVVSLVWVCRAFDRLVPGR